MIVIGMGQGKGGVGKTTLGINLAGELVRAGHSVTVFDADPQGSAADWAIPHKLPFPVRSHPLAPRKNVQWVRDILKSNSDFVIIDLPAGFGAMFETAVLIMDILLIPCCPSSMDINAAQKTITETNRIRRAEDDHSALKIIAIPNRVDLSNDEGKEITTELKSLGRQIYIAPVMSYNIDFVRCFSFGETVASTPQSHSSREVVGIMDYILDKV